MAELTTRARKALPKSKFGLPSRKGKSGENAAGRGAYPMPDRAHAANAKARASQQFDKGNLSASAKAEIDAKANKVLQAGKHLTHESRTHPLAKGK